MVERYSLLRQIGYGAFGTIYLANCSWMGESVTSVALKVVPSAGKIEVTAGSVGKPDNKRGKKEINSLADEFRILSSVSHPAIVRVIEFLETVDFPVLPSGLVRSMTDVSAVESSTSSYPDLEISPILQLSDVIIMEYASGGDLFDLVSENGRVTEELARKYAKQLISALEYLHDLGYIHGDVKLENILLFPDGILKLTDFGFARKWSPLSRQRISSGTLQYSAPALIRQEPVFGPEIDIWAFGVVLYQMVIGRDPFAMKDGEYYKEFKLLPGGKTKMPFGGVGSQDVRSLIKAIFREGLLASEREKDHTSPMTLLQGQPFPSLTWATIRKSPWIAEVSFAKERKKSERSGETNSGISELIPATTLQRESHV